MLAEKDPVRYRPLRSDCEANAHWLVFTPNWESLELRPLTESEAKNLCIMLNSYLPDKENSNG